MHLTSLLTENGLPAPEQGRRVITYELPVDSLEQHLRKLAPVFFELMQRTDLGEPR